MAEQATVTFSVQNAERVQAFVAKLKADATIAERQAARAEQKVSGAFGRLAKTGFTAIGTQAIAFAVNEVVSSAVDRESSNRLFGALTGIGTAAATGFAFGGPVGAAGAVLTATVSQLGQEVREWRARQEALEKILEKDRNRAAEAAAKAEEARIAREERLEARLEQVRQFAQREAFKIAQNTYRYL